MKIRLRETCQGRTFPRETLNRRLYIGSLFVWRPIYTDSVPSETASFSKCLRLPPLHGEDGIVNDPASF